METKWQAIVNQAWKILEGCPDGIRYSRFIEEIQKALPNQKENTIQGNIWRLHLDYPDKVFKPSKGIFKLIKYKRPDESGEAPTAANAEFKSVPGVVKETDFYESFSRFLVDSEECTKAISLGGNKFGGKWGTPDVIGKWESRPSDIIKAQTLIISAEIKLDYSYLIEAFGQACCYKLFSHKSYLVVPSYSAQGDKDRLDALCLLYGIGLVYYDSKDPSDPKFRAILRAQRHEPDMYYLNENIKALEGELFS